MKISISYSSLILKPGLEQDEAAAYVPSEEAVEEIRESMVRFGLEVDRYERIGMLKS